MISHYEMMQKLHGKLSEEERLERVLRNDRFDAFLHLMVFLNLLGVQSAIANSRKGFVDIYDYIERVTTSPSDLNKP